jgi:hypothetical protein
MVARPLRFLFLACAIAFALCVLTYHVALASAESSSLEKPDSVPRASVARSRLAAPLPQAGGPTTATLRAASGAVGDAKGRGKSPQDVYQEALEATKQYMHGAVPWGVPPEWLR